MPLNTSTLYTPLVPVVAPGTVAVAAESLDTITGPDHAYPVTLTGPLAMSDNVLPAHIGELLLASESVGREFTVTGVV